MLFTDIVFSRVEAVIVKTLTLNNKHVFIDLENIRGRIIVECVNRGVMKTVPSVYTVLINNIYLSRSTQVAGGTVFRAHMVTKQANHLSFSSPLIIF